MLAGGIVAAIMTSIALFAITNADDIVMLTTLNASSRVVGRPREWHIWAGQYAGFTILIVASLAAAAGLTQVPVHWLWLLGLLPLGLGLVKLVGAIRARGSGGSGPPVMNTGLIGVMGLTIANGSDNVSVYIPVFRTSSLAGIVLVIVVFMVGTALYCLAGSRFAARRSVTELIERWGQWIVPAVFVLIGLYVFYKAGALAQI
jgi:cadmium resistance protein CadD (predicted permease)